MSSTYAQHGDNSQRSWWPLKSQPSKDFNEKSSSKPSISLNTLASAIGFKSKKHPSLTIQKPPVSLISSPPISPGRPLRSPSFQTRPPSQSVSSTRSRVDSLGPKTPVDHHRSSPSRGSLLTLSDQDPFASRGIITPNALDPNRLSAYSSSSTQEYTAKAPSTPTDSNRVSYASSSSQSNTMDMSPLHPNFTPDHSPPKHLSPRKSTGSLRHPSYRRDTDADSLASAWETLNHGPAPPSILLFAGPDKNRLSQPDLPVAPKPRPHMRARGLTDSGARGPPQGFLRTDISATPSASSSTSSLHQSPRVVVRQPSIARIGMPTSAPPSHDLPLPPPPLPSTTSSGTRPPRTEDLIPAVPRLTSTSQSSPVFTTSLAMNRDLSISTTYNPRRRPSDASSIMVTEQLGPRTLKKATSQQSLSSSSSRPHASHSASDSRVPQDKSVRKQRSFHNQRIPVPTIPLRHSNSSNVINDPISQTTIDSSKRGSSNIGSPPPVRKRLFSASSMRRTSTSNDDDTRSIFSLPESHCHTPGKSSVALAPITTSLSGLQSPPSFWDEITPKTTAGSPTTDYTPQKIMSTAELLKLEERLVEEESDRMLRKRGMSVASAQTFASHSTQFSIMSSPSTLLHASSMPASPTRTTSLVVKIPPTSPPHKQPRRPSTSHSPITRSHDTDAIIRADVGMLSLSPPPRSWSRSIGSGSAPSVPGALNAHGSPLSSAAMISLPPPPRSKVRRKPSVEKTIDKASRRRSLMRKPSFLDIGDDDDGKHEVTPLMPIFDDAPSSSFLDFARESFDTNRSQD